MKDVNKIILVGRLGADPIQKETKNGNNVVRFPLATSRKFKDDTVTEPTAETPAYKEETQWHQIVVWGKQTEFCVNFLKKGYSVLVEGAVKYRKFQDPDGKMKYFVEVQADNVNFLGQPRKKADVDVAVETEALAETG